MGAYERGSYNDGSVHVQIMEEITHPEYNPDTHEYDFRLLRVGGWVSHELHNATMFAGYGHDAKLI